MEAAKWYLHRAIREQGGAYGAGASQDSQTGAFRFFPIETPEYPIPWTILTALLIALDNPLGTKK